MLSLIANYQLIRETSGVCLFSQAICPVILRYSNPELRCSNGPEYKYVPRAGSLGYKKVPGASSLRYKEEQEG